MKLFDAVSHTFFARACGISTSSITTLPNGADDDTDPVSISSARSGVSQSARFLVE